MLYKKLPLDCYLLCLPFVLSAYLNANDTTYLAKRILWMFLSDGGPHLMREHKVSRLTPWLFSFLQPESKIGAKLPDKSDRHCQAKGLHFYKAECRHWLKKRKQQVKTNKFRETTVGDQLQC